MIASMAPSAQAFADFKQGAWENTFSFQNPKRPLVRSTQNFSEDASNSQACDRGHGPEKEEKQIEDVTKTESWVLSGPCLRMSVHGCGQELSRELSREPCVHVGATQHYRGRLNQSLNFQVRKLRPRESKQVSRGCTVSGNGRKPRVLSDRLAEVW